MVIKKTLALTTLAVACGLIACSEQPTALSGVVDGPDLKAAQAATTFTTNDFIDVTGATLFNVCTDENIVAAGRIHVQFHVTDTGDGIQISGNANLAGLSATGEDSGRKYRIVGRSSRSFGKVVLTPGGAEIAHFVLHQRWVTAGPGNDRVFERGSHLTVNANGELVSFHLFTEPATCQ